MNKKDIALTVAGVLATMVVAYLIYKMQQRDAAAAAAGASADQVTSEQAAIASMSDQLNAYQFAESLPQITTPSVTGVTTNTSASVSSSSDTADLGAYVDSTDINQLLGSIIQAFGGNLASSQATPAELSTLQIPSVTGVQETALSGVPVTAQQAAAQAILTAAPSITTLTSDSAAYPIAMQTGAGVSSHPVTAHPIVTTGS